MRTYIQIKVPAVYNCGYPISRFYSHNREPTSNCARCKCKKTAASTPASSSRLTDCVGERTLDCVPHPRPPVVHEPTTRLCKPNSTQSSSECGRSHSPLPSPPSSLATESPPPAAAPPRLVERGLGRRRARTAPPIASASGVPYRGCVAADGDVGPTPIRQEPAAVRPHGEEGENMRSRVRCLVKIRVRFRYEGRN